MALYVRGARAQGRRSFDVLKEVAPSYAVRAVGMAIAVTVLGGFWLFCVNELMKQDGATLRDLCPQKCENCAPSPRKPAPRRHSVDRSRAAFFWKGIKEYLRPGFHPNDRDHQDFDRENAGRPSRKGVV